MDELSSQEEPLNGGNTAESSFGSAQPCASLQRPSTSAVQVFVMHLRSAGFQAPEPLGVDNQGRQVWEYIPGSLWHTSKSHTPADLRRVGALIRDLHEAAASFHAPEDARWNRRYGRDEHDLVCHNDLAPWNLVCGETRWTFIDWDAAAPATRLWDLA